MTDIRLYLVELENNQKGEATQVAANAAKRLQTKELRLVELIESAGEYLNHETPVTRERAMSFLGEVIANTPNGVLPLQHRNLLLEFVIARIADREIGIGSCSKSLLALEERGTWDKNQARKVIETLMEFTYPLAECGSQTQRYPTLLLVDLLMAKYRQVLLDISKDNPQFLTRLISYFDGEKDPRNLMIVFSILNVIGTEWDASACVQELFDAAFNYFPITFRPPPDDTFKITAQDLKDRLRICLSSSPAFAPYALPALLDKLDSTSMNTKRDVLHTLQSIVQNYGPKSINQYSITLWDAIKFEILQSQEEDLAKESLKVLAGISQTLSRGPEAGLSNYLKPVVKECNEHLEDAPTKQSEAAERMLYAIACTSWEACNFIIAGVLPQLFVLYHSTKDMPKRRALITTLGKIVEASVQVFGEWTFNPYQQQNGTGVDPIRYGKSENNALHTHSKQALEVLIDGLTNTPIGNVSYRLALLSVSRQLIRVREGLSDGDISRIIKILNDMIIVEQSYGKDEARIAAIWNLDEIAKQKPQLIIDQSFPAFLAKLPDTDSGSEDKYLAVLEAFARIGVEDKIFSTVVVRLRNKLNAAIHQDASSEYIKAILSALLFAISNTTANLEGTDTTCPYYNDLVLPLITTVPVSLKPHQQDDLVFGLIGKVCNEILRRQSSAFQTTIVELISQSVDISTTTSTEQSRRLLITSGLLAALRRDVSLPCDKGMLLTRFVDFTKVEILSPGARVAAVQILSLLVNKFLSIADLKTILPPILDELSRQPQSILVAFAILKAQVLRNAPGLNTAFTALVNALSDPSTGLTVAHGFSTLLQLDEILTKQNHCVISPLHKQKTFAMLVPDIAQQVRLAEPEAKKNYLVALSGILRWLPFAIIESEVSSLGPLLLQTLDITGEDDIKVGAIDQITSVLYNKGQMLEEHVGSVITRLLNMSSSDKDPPRLRAKALQCLSLVPTRLKTEIVIPYRKQVIKRLTVALDDRRRAVRAEAVRCRTKWIEIDEVGSADQDDD